MTQNFVSLGMHKKRVDSSVDFLNIEHIPIERSEVHPLYNPVTHENDLWMIKLQWPTHLYANQVVDLDTPTDGYTLAPGNLLTAMGFGMWQNSNNGYPNVLQEITLQHISKDDCVNNHGFLASEITSDMFCAGHVDGQGTCFVSVLYFIY
jgi:hypothetical protein